MSKVRVLLGAVLAVTACLVGVGSAAALAGGDAGAGAAWCTVTDWYGCPPPTTDTTVKTITVTTPGSTSTVTTPGTTTTVTSPPVTTTVTTPPSTTTVTVPQTIVQTVPSQNTTLPAQTVTVTRTVPASQKTHAKKHKAKKHKRKKPRVRGKVQHPVHHGGGVTGACDTRHPCRPV